MHTAEWDYSVDLKNKVVGVVGSGLSAIQVIPEIVTVVKELHCIQRNPIWIGPKPFTSTYGKCVRWIQRTFPFVGKLGRWTALIAIDFAHIGTRENCANKFGKNPRNGFSNLFLPTATFPLQ